MGELEERLEHRAVPGAVPPVERTRAEGIARPR